MGINERSLGPEDGSFMNESISLGRDWVSYHKSILTLLIELHSSHYILIGGIERLLGVRSPLVPWPGSTEAGRCKGGWRRVAGSGREFWVPE